MWHVTWRVSAECGPYVCHVLQCVAVCCSVLPCVSHDVSLRVSLLQCVAVCCSVLQRIAGCVTWRFLACVTVAVCCSACHLTFPYVWMCDMSYVTWLVTWRVGAKCGAAGDARRLPPPRKHCGPLEYQRAQHYHVWQALHTRAHARRAKPRAQRL